MKGAWLEVFKSGTHTSASGVEKTYTDDDLTSIANTYNAQKEHEAPLVIGHPETDAPAYGWAKEMKVVGNRLLAYVGQVSDDVVDAVDKGLYKKVSIALYPGGLLRHIGLLGAVPPAVKGLAPVQFAAGMEFDEYIWATDETRMPIVARVISAIRDFLIEKFGLELADRTIDKLDIEALTSRAESKLIVVDENNKAASPQASFNENKQKEELEMDEIKKLIEELTKKFTDQFNEVFGQITEIKTSMVSQKETSDKMLKKTARDAQQVAFAAFCEQLIAEGKVLPAEKDGMIEQYSDLLSAEDGLTFAEGDKRPAEKMMDRLKQRPIIIAKTAQQFADGKKIAPLDKKDIPDAFSEVGDKLDTASVEVDKQIRAYAEQNKVSYEEAAAAFARA